MKRRAQDVRQTESLKRRFASRPWPVVSAVAACSRCCCCHIVQHDRPPRVIRAHGARGKTTRASERDGFIFGRDLRNSGRDDAATRGLEGRRRSMCVAFASRFIPRRPYCCFYYTHALLSLAAVRIADRAPPASGAKLLRRFHAARRTVLAPGPISCTDYLEPFLETIRQEDTSGVVTQRALCAVRAFLSAGLLTLDPANEASAIVSIVHAATFCRFEVTDPAADEVVLMCILQLLVTCVQCPSGGKLSDEAVCEVVHSCFRISSQVRVFAAHHAHTSPTLQYILTVQPSPSPLLCTHTHTRAELPLRPAPSRGRGGPTLDGTDAIQPYTRYYRGRSLSRVRRPWF